MATIRKKGDLQWHVQIRKKGFPAQTKTLNTKPEAEAWAAVIESEMARGVFVSRAEAEQTTLKEAFYRYLEEVTPTKKGAKQEGYRIGVLLRSTLANRSIASIRSTDIAKYRDGRLKIVAENTVRNEMNTFSGLFETCRTEWGINIENPCRAVKRPRMPKGRDRRLSSGELETLFTVCYESETYYLLPAVVLAIETGMRRGELATVRYEHVKNNIIKLGETKNGDKRDVPLSSRAKEAMKSFPRQLSGRLFPVGPATITQAFRRAVKNAGIEDMTFHDLRHEAASRLFELGLNPMEVASITGHKTLQMLKRYTHLRAEDLAIKLG